MPAALAMYLNTVLADIQKESAPPKALNAEHLYKMNEAIFNLPEEDHIDAKMSAKLFQAITKVREAYNYGKICDSDHNFFYDYVALLGTLQNQHFFSQKQTDKMLLWVKEAIDDGNGGSPPPAAPPKEVAVSTKAEEKKLKKLEEENRKLKDELEKLTALAGAVEVLKTFKPVSAVGGSKGKAKGKGKGKNAESKAPEDSAAEEGTTEEKKKAPREKAKAKPKAKEAGKKWKAKESTGGDGA